MWMYRRTIPKKCTNNAIDNRHSKLLRSIATCPSALLCLIARVPDEHSDTYSVQPAARRLAQTITTIPQGRPF